MLTLSPALQLLKILSQKWLQFGWSVKIGMQSSLTACKLHAALSTITSGQFEKCLSVFGRPPPSINVNIFQYFFVVCSRAPGSVLTFPVCDISENQNWWLKRIKSGLADHSVTLIKTHSHSQAAGHSAPVHAV